MCFKALSVMSELISSVCLGDSLRSLTCTLLSCGGSQGWACLWLRSLLCLWLCPALPLLELPLLAALDYSHFSMQVGDEQQAEMAYESAAKKVGDQSVV